MSSWFILKLVTEEEKPPSPPPGPFTPAPRESAEEKKPQRIVVRFDAAVVLERRIKREVEAYTELVRKAPQREPAVELVNLEVSGVRLPADRWNRLLAEDEEILLNI